MQKIMLWGLGALFFLTGSLIAQPGIIVETVDLDTLSKRGAEIIKGNMRSYLHYVIKIDSSTNLDKLACLEGWEDLSLEIDLASVPERFRSFDMSQCKSLSVNGASVRLKNLVALEVFTKIEVLNLSHYYGESLPNEIKTLSKLRSLSIRNSPYLEELEVLGSMPNIEQITLNDVPSLSRFPAFSPSNHITNLNLYLSDSCKLEYLSSVPRLIYLNIGGSNLTYFPDSAFSELKGITLSRCKSLCSISGLGRALNLSRITLHNTGIKEIRGDFSALHLERFEIRDNLHLLSTSGLKSVGNLDELEITNSPNLMGFGTENWDAKIREIYLTNLPKLSDIGPIKGIGNLVRLNINHTGIERFPEYFKRLQSLNIMYLYNNLALRDLGELSQMQNLVHLHISNSPLIREIPLTFASNQSLKSATFELKNLEAIDGLVGLSALASLSIKFESEYFTLPTEFYQTYQLSSIYLEGPIRDISPLLSIPQLSSVCLNGAQIKTWPKGFSPSSVTLKQTSFVDLSGLDGSKLNFLHLMNNPHLERVPSRDSLEMIQNLSIRRNPKLKIAPYTTSYKWRIMENDDQ